MGYEWKTEGKNYIELLQHCPKIRKKINTKFYLRWLILILKNSIFTTEIIDNKFNILVYYTFTVYYCFNIHSELLYCISLYRCNFCKVVISAVWKSISVRGLYCYCLLYVLLLSALCIVIVCFMYCYFLLYVVLTDSDFVQAKTCSKQQNHIDVTDGLHSFMPLMKHKTCIKKFG